MLSLSYWTGQRLNCWVLSLLLGCTEYFKVAVWVGPTNHRDAKDRKWTNVCVSGSHDFLALMHIDPSRVFRPITCGGLVFQKGRTRGRVGRSRLLLWRVKGKALSSSEWVEGGAVTPGSGLGFQLLLSLAVWCVTAEGICRGQTHFQQKRGEGANYCHGWVWEERKVEPLTEIITSQINSGWINKVLID